MIAKVMASINNYFVHSTIAGHFVIEEGSITLPFLNGQYYRIQGSVFNDGVFKYGDTDTTLIDEEFDGIIYGLAPPNEFISLCEEIEAFCESPAGKISPYSSESFGGYSYTKASGKSGGPITWQDAYAKELRRWRKI